MLTRSLAATAGVLLLASLRADIVINEIHYDPDVKTELVEFIELYNSGPQAVDLSGWALTSAVNFTFAAGTAIAPDGYIVVAQNPGRFNAKFHKSALGPWTGKLGNSGEEIILRNPSGASIDKVDFQLGFPWPTVGTEPGRSIELANPAFDNDLGGNWRGSPAGPTPLARNGSFTTNLPPAIRQVDHSPSQPIANQTVRIEAKVTDPEGVASVQLQYQEVSPGAYIALEDAAYATSWTTLPMNDAGADGDQIAGDSVYSATIPASVQTHRKLVRYRIVATDANAKSITAPYADDPQPNFAYFCHNGVPGWSGAIQPGSADQSRAQAVSYSPAVMNSLPVYHLISKKTSVENATWKSQYQDNDYPWTGALVYDGKVYDHIHYRARGGVWRYAMGKNMWKMDFNRGHDFKPRDNWGREYSVGWTKLNLGACIQQGDYQHRGEQGMFESVGLRLFNLAGLEAPKTQFAQFRIIDESAEAPASQYNGDFWGLYLAVEQEDSRFLEEHALPDSNLYKMENGFGTLNNQGPLGATDGSDLWSFLDSINSTQPESWWRENFDVAKYYSYRTIVEGIHHYDIDGNPGKNYFYFNNDETRKWEVHAWDLDLTWADNMYGGGNEQFRSRVLPIANLNREYKNRIREIRDLLFNTDEAYKLIDEYAAMIWSPSGPSFVGADRAQWDYNPIMISQYVYSSKAGQGRFYQKAATKDFPGMVQIMKTYIVARGGLLDSISSDTKLPARPTLANISPAHNPANRLSFQASAYSGTDAGAAIKFRIGEITPAGQPAFDRNNPRVYEIEPVWESSELALDQSAVNAPSGVVKVGHTYRARVKYKDVSGRWSNWSAPAEFIAGEADNAVALVENLRVTEMMFNPPAGSDYEFIELHNASPALTLDLAGVKFTAGIDFAFPPGAQLAPGAYGLVTRNASAANFRAHYGLDLNVPVFGPYSGSLNNDGEEVTLKTAPNGAVISTFAYGDNGSWPVAADGAGHSMVPWHPEYPQDTGTLSYPGHWRASFFMKGSPGAAEPEMIAGPVINEIMANTHISDAAHPEYDSNDWIEIANHAAASVNFADFYLSDDASNLKKWALPAGTLPAGGWIVFDEISGFHSPIASGFGIDQAGEEIYLSCLPGNAADRVCDAVKFKGQTADASWARLQDGTGFFRAAIPTKGSRNLTPVTSLVISEIMYHPPTNAPSTLDNTLDEFVEIWNTTSASLPLFTTNGGFRIDGGIKFTFATNTVLEAGKPLLLVNFNPTLAATSNAFRAKYNVPAGVRVLGPYSGKLGNTSDRVAIERPELPEVVGGDLAWVVIDQVTYGQGPLWPMDANGLGKSLRRLLAADAGNEAGNWVAGAPDPGIVPVPAEELRIASSAVLEGRFVARVPVVTGKTYLLQRCNDLASRQWQTLVAFVASSTGAANIADPATLDGASAFYRVEVQP